MKSYQDLLELGENEKGRMDFVRSVVKDHTGSKAYSVAVDAALYYDGENPTINRYEKIIYDLQGRAHVDMWTANHKIASNFFGKVVDQEVSYLLGNGVTFGEDSTKDKLGEEFDQDIMDLLEYARIGGVSYGFWNLDHLEKFKVTEFAPLYDNETGALRSGVRFWSVGDGDTLAQRFTLYEEDGYTDYIQRKGEDMEILHEKRAYKLTVASSEADGDEIVNGENYPGFPIVPLLSDRNGKSALTGKRNTIDALDLVTSNMVNNVDEGNLIYWVINNAGGMDDLDDARFLDKIRTMHVAHTDDEATAEPHTIEAPFEGTNATIDVLEKRLYSDFQAFDPASVTAANQSATAIKAAYVPLDLKCDKIERQVTRFILGILKLAGIDDKPSYTRNQISNDYERIQALTMAAQYLPEDYITEKLLYIMGDADRVEQVLNQMTADEYDRLNGGTTGTEGEENV